MVLAVFTDGGAREVALADISMDIKSIIQSVTMTELGIKCPPVYLQVNATFLI